MELMTSADASALTDFSDSGNVMGAALSEVARNVKPRMSYAVVALPGTTGPGQGYPNMLTIYADGEKDERSTFTESTWQEFVKVLTQKNIDVLNAGESFRAKCDFMRYRGDGFGQVACLDAETRGWVKSWTSEISFNGISFCAWKKGELEKYPFKISFLSHAAVAQW